MVAVLTLLSTSPAYKQVSDEDGYLSRSTTIKANSKIVKERIWIAFQSSHPDNGAPLHEERVIAVRDEPNLHYELHQRHAIGGVQPPWKLLVDVVSNSFHEVITVAKKIENTTQPVLRLDFHTCTIEDLDPDALWLASLNRHPGTHTPKSVTDCDGYREEEWEVVYRDVNDGKESETECAISLRGHPMEIEVCERNLRSGFRLHARIAKSEASVLFKLMTKSARKLVVEPPVTVGLGFCTATIHDISYDSLFTAKVFTAVKPCMARRV